MGRLSNEISDLKARVTVVESKIDAVGNLQNQTYTLVQSVQDMASTMKHMLEEQKDMKLEQKDIKNDIQTLKEEPLKSIKESDRIIKTEITKTIGTFIGGGIVWAFVQYALTMVK